MKSNEEYLGDGLDYETRLKHPSDPQAWIDGGSFGSLSYLASSLASENSEWCRAEILRLIQLGKDLESQKQAEAA
jgi:hypothetical protein